MSSKVSLVAFLIVTKVSADPVGFDTRNFRPWPLGMPTKTYIRTYTGSENKKPVLCSTQLSMTFQLLIKAKMLKNNAVKLLAFVLILLINVKRPTIVGILTFMSRINFVLI